MVSASVTFGRQQSSQPRAPTAISTILAEIAALPGGRLVSHDNVEYGADAVRRCKAGMPQLEGAVQVLSYADGDGNLITMASHKLDAGTVKKGKSVGQRIIHAETGGLSAKATIRSSEPGMRATQTFSQAKYDNGNTDVVLMERYEDPMALPSLQVRRDDTSTAPERPLVGQYVVDTLKRVAEAHEEAAHAPPSALIVSGDQAQNHLTSVAMQKSSQEKASSATIIEDKAAHQGFRATAVALEPPEVRSGRPVPAPRAKK